MRGGSPITDELGKAAGAVSTGRTIFKFGEKAIQGYHRGRGDPSASENDVQHVSNSKYGGFIYLYASTAGVLKAKWPVCQDSILKWSSP